MTKRLTSLVLLAALAASPLAAAPCGGDFGVFVKAMAAEAQDQGLPAADVKTFFTGARQDPAVLKADRAQGIFRKPFVEFSQALISANRLENGAAYSRKFDAVFARSEAEFGVPRGILLAFWAFETDFGAVQGDFNPQCDPDTGA